MSMFPNEFSFAFSAALTAILEPPYLRLIPWHKRSAQGTLPVMDGFPPPLKTSKAAGVGSAAYAMCGHACPLRSAV